MTSTPVYFVSCTSCFAQVDDPGHWRQTGATSLDGAKRIATKRAEGATYTARVAMKTAQGEFTTVATLHNSSAITRTRAKWVHSHR